MATKLRYLVVRGKRILKSYGDLGCARAFQNAVGGSNVRVVKAKVVFASPLIEDGEWESTTGSDLSGRLQFLGSEFSNRIESFFRGSSGEMTDHLSEADRSLCSRLRKLIEKTINQAAGKQVAHVSEPPIFAEQDLPSVSDPLRYGCNVSIEAVDADFDFRRDPQRATAALLRQQANRLNRAADALERLP